MDGSSHICYVKTTFNRSLLCTLSGFPFVTCALVITSRSHTKYATVSWISELNSVWNPEQLSNKLLYLWSLARNHLPVRQDPPLYGKSHLLDLFCIVLYVIIVERRSLTYTAFCCMDGWSVLISAGSKLTDSTPICISFATQCTSPLRKPSRLLDCTTQAAILCECYWSASLVISFWGFT